MSKSGCQVEVELLELVRLGDFGDGMFLLPGTDAAGLCFKAGITVFRADGTVVRDWQTGWGLDALVLPLDPACFTIRKTREA